MCYVHNQGYTGIHKAGAGSNWSTPCGIMTHCDSFIGHVQQAQPNNGRMEVDLEGVSLQMDTFRPLGSPYAWRLAFSIHQLEASLPPLFGFDISFPPTPSTPSPLDTEPSKTFQAALRNIHFPNVCSTDSQIYCIVTAHGSPRLLRLDSLRRRTCDVCSCVSQSCRQQLSLDIRTCTLCLNPER